MPEARTTRIQIPKEFVEWVETPANANRLADEYNALLKFLAERESRLEQVDPQHAGFMVFMPMLAMCMGSTTAMPDQLSSALFDIAEGFLMMATPVLDREKGNVQ